MNFCSHFLNLHFLITCISEGGLLSHWTVVYNYYLLKGSDYFIMSVSWALMRRHWISSCLTSAAYIFTLYLFELRSVAFHWLLPSGDFSLAVEQWGINNTCLSLKCTFIKRAAAALHKMHTQWHFYRQLLTAMLRPLIFHRDVTQSLDKELYWEVCRGHITREQ